MRRQMMRSALALFALLALSGCGVERLTGPQVDVGTGGRSGGMFSPRREDDPKDLPADPGGVIGSAADTLRAGEDVR